MHASQGTGSFNALGADEPFPGVLRQSFSSKQATVSRYTFSPRANFPLHRHPQEQITLVQEGSVEMTVEGERSKMGAGEFSIVPGNVEHGITAGDAGARILAVVIPKRESPDELEITSDGTTGE